MISLLETRGLAIPDHERAAHYFRCIGYYRLAAYLRYYTDDEKHEHIKAGTSFEDVLALYIFDRKIRNLLIDALERIEVAVKAHLCDHVSLRGKNPFWLCDPANFNYNRHGQVLEILDTALDGKKGDHPHPPIAHFYRHYDGPYPPCWMLMESISFGKVSSIYKLLRGERRIPVARDFGLQHDVLENWLHSLAFARNICAHHGKVWNRIFVITPQIPKAYRGVWPENSKQRLYLVCCLIQHMMQKIADGSSWGDRLRELIALRPGVPVARMGFPDKWEELAFWSKPGSLAS
jgi:abortive infection bacteriophage resistance protein